MRVLGIDVGIVNVGMCLIEQDLGSRQPTVREWRHIDMTVMRHRRVTRIACALGHTNCLADRVAHMVQEDADLFAVADFIAIEQQPIMGHVAVEQLLFSMHRDRARLVSPVGMHKRYGMRDLDYEQRKVRSGELFAMIAEERTTTELSRRERSHDIYDACLIARFCLENELRKQREAAVRADMTLHSTTTPFSLEHDNIDEYFNRFRYKKSLT